MGVARTTHVRAWKLMKAAVKATGGGDREMLAPTNDGHFIWSQTIRHSNGMF